MNVQKRLGDGYEQQLVMQEILRQTEKIDCSLV